MGRRVSPEAAKAMQQSLADQHGAWWSDSPLHPGTGRRKRILLLTSVPPAKRVVNLSLASL